MSEEKTQAEEKAASDQADETDQADRAKQEDREDRGEKTDDGAAAQEDALNPAQARPIVEALLFASHEPLSVRKLSNILKGISGKDIRKIILELREEYDAQGRGFQILEVAKGFQMATRAAHSEYVTQLSRHKKRNPLSNAALETLAIIAYKQPIIRADVEAVRGVDSSGVIRSLMDNDLVKVVGKKEVIGRPPLYGTTDEFLKVFGLRKLSDLPSIKELKKMFAEKIKEDEEKEKEKQEKESEAQKASEEE